MLLSYWTARRPCQNMWYDHIIHVPLPNHYLVNNRITSNAFLLLQMRYAFSQVMNAAAPTTHRQHVPRLQTLSVMLHLVYANVRMVLLNKMVNASRRAVRGHCSAIFIIIVERFKLHCLFYRYVLHSCQ